MAKELRLNDQTIADLTAKVDLWRQWLTGDATPPGMPAPTDGHKNLVLQVEAFAGGADTPGDKHYPDTYTKLLGALGLGPSTEMQSRFKTFAGGVKAELDVLVKSLDDITLGLAIAKMKFKEGEDHALTAAEMFEILSSPSTPPPPGPSGAPPAP
ncbi:hypothetical protein ACFV4F_38905 [Kitasatospora sp. NPDC059722]|uniref:hypothetical protein n=1 Tax=unclassified Kitasatospora TaxID=2633591 RepID=UPI00366898B7